MSQWTQLSDLLLAFGLSFENMVLPFLFLNLPFLPLIIPVSLIFAFMLVFARLSADGEYAALLSSGFSLGRLLPSLMTFLFIVYGFTFFCSNSLESWGIHQYRKFVFKKTQSEIDNIVKFKIRPGVFTKNFFGYIFYGEKISKDRVGYTNIIITPENKSEAPFFLLTAPYAEIVGSVEQKRLTMTVFDGMLYSQNKEHEEKITVVKFKKNEINLLQLFQEQITRASAFAENFTMLDSYSLSKLIQDHRNFQDKAKYIAARSLFHSRLSNPMLVFTCSFLGITTGIFDPRKRKNWAYFNTIMGMLFIYVFLAFFKWLGDTEVLDIGVSVWVSQIFLLFFSLFLLHQKNTLPLSESVFSLKNWRR